MIDGTSLLHILTNLDSLISELLLIDKNISVDYKNIEIGIHAQATNITSNEKISSYQFMSVYLTDTQKISLLIASEDSIHYNCQLDFTVNKDIESRELFTLNN